MYYFILKSILGSIVGSSFYNWFQDTKVGIWFQKTLDNALEKVQQRYDLQIFEKESKWKEKYPNLEIRFKEIESRLGVIDYENEYMILTTLDRLERRVETLEAALDNIIPERRQGAD